jgi:D-proline reductase (dithiol) PrdB
MNIHVSNTGSLRQNTDLSIVEQPLEWLQAFQDNWLAHLEKTGETNWSVYTRVYNKLTPSGKGIQLNTSRLLFITSIGAFIPGQHPPFDEFNPLGDYSIRLIPSDTPLKNLDFSNAHIDLSAVQQDPQTLLPLGLLQSFVEQGKLGELAPEFISFNGYHPHAIRVVKELIPTILKTAKKQQVDAALLVPCGPLCVQSAGLVARALEVNGIATTITTNNGKYVKLTAPPRAIISKLQPGCVLGNPHDPAQQRQVLETTLALLEQDAPLEFLEI